MVELLFLYFYPLQVPRFSFPFLIVASLVFLLSLMPLIGLAADFPTIPADLTTPVQQRLAMIGPTGTFVNPFNVEVSNSNASN